MQKIIEDREKRKKKWIRLGKISAISLVSIIIAVRILCSSYAFCNWYLPLASHSLGIRITADEVKFTPFSSKKHLNFRGLQVEIKDKLIFTATSFKTKISFYDLIFCNQYTLDNVDVKKASLVIYDLQKTDNKKESSGLERIRIGTVAINDLFVRYAPEHSAVYGNAFFDDVQINSMQPDRVNTMKIRSFLGWNMPDSSIMNLPMESEIQFMLDQELAPVMLKADISTKKLNGHIYQQDISGLQLKAFLDCWIDEKSKVTINRISVQQLDDERETFLLNASGLYDIGLQCGSLQITAAADKMSVPLIPTRYSPRDLNLRFSGTLIQNETELLLDSKLKLDAESIVKDTQTIIQKPKINFDSRLVWNSKRKNLTISSCMLEAFSKDSPLLNAHTSDKFALTINQDTSWNLAADDSSLQLKITECPLSVLNCLIPFHFQNGSLTSSCELKVDARQKSVTGIINGTVKDVELLHNGKALVKKTPMYFKGELRSNVLENIPGFDIVSANIVCGSENFASLNMTGNVHLKTDEIDLKGILKTDLPVMLDHCSAIDQQKSKDILAFFGNSTKQDKHEIAFHFFPRKKVIDFSIRSTFNELTLPMMEQAVKLNVACKGQLTQKEDAQQIRLKEISLKTPDKLDLWASADILLPEETFQGQLRIKRLSPDLLRGFWIACDPGKAKGNWYRKNHFKNMKISANLWYSEKQQKIKISNVSLLMTQPNGGTANLVLNAPITGTVNPCRLNDTPATATFKKFPLEYINTFSSDQSAIKIVPAMIDCTIKFTLRNNFKDIPFHIDGTVDHLRFSKDGNLYDFGRCKFNSDAEFGDIFSSLTYKNADFDLEKHGSKMKISSSGTCLFDPPHTSSYSFHTNNLNGDYVYSFLPAKKAPIKFSQAKAKASLNLNFEQNYDIVKLLLKQDIDQLTPLFPEDATVSPPELHGNLHLDLVYRAPEQILTLNKSSFRLMDLQGSTRYHAELHGSWDGSKNNRSSCSFISHAADIETAYLMFNAAKKKPAQATEKNDSAETVSTEQKKAKTADKIKNTIKGENEPPAVDLNDFSTKLTVDLKNWTFTDNLKFAMKGVFTVDQNIFHAQKLSGTINKAPFLLDAYADLGKNDGWILKLFCKVNDLEVAPLLNAFGGDALKSRNITGKIDKMELNVSTKGVTNNSLDKNFICNIKADFSKISCPFMREDEERSAWQNMLIPLTIFPRLYDLLPEGAARKAVQDSLGGSHIDVLTGNKNIPFDRGTISIQNAKDRKTDLIVTKALFTGPVFQIASKDLVFNPFHNSIRAEILARFMGVVYPIKLNGTLDEPDFELPNIVGNALLAPIKEIIKDETPDHIWNIDSPPVTSAK